MTYDAENRMLTASSGGTYVYDGEGKRVKRVAGGQTWWYVYGIGGELLAEYLSGAPTTVKKEYGYRAGQMLVVWDADKSGDERLKWLVQDHLGSTRVEADKSGSLSAMKRHDYAPFGEEMTAGIRQSGGVGQYGYEPPQSNVRQKFTGYERDNESGLDFAQARYYANGQGRFTSSDLPFADQFQDNAQSWNIYSYVRNNPLNARDPRGRDTCYYEGNKVLACDGDKKRIAGIDYENNLIYIRDKKGDVAPHKLDARFIVRGGGDTVISPADLAFEMNRRAPALNKFGEVGGMAVVGIVALPTLGLAGGGITTIGLSGFPAMTNVPNAANAFAVLWSSSGGLPSIANAANAIVLQTEAWTVEIQAMWLARIAASRIPVYVGSAVGGANRLFNAQNGNIKELGKEVYFLINRGYTLVQNAQGYWLMPPR